MIKPSLAPIFSNEKDIFHGFFTRHGGCSPPPYLGLNVSFGVGDKPSHVHENRQRIQNHLGSKSLISARQTHGKRVAIITEPQESAELDGFDGLICSVPGIAIMIQQADCQGVLLYDPAKKIVAAVHSGWQGSVANIIQETISTMTLTFGSEPRDLLAGISSSLGPCCAEFVNFKTELPMEFQKFQTSPNHFDFWGISKKQLMSEGVLESHIDINGTCTKCSDNFFSYRRNRLTGRCCSVIGLRHE